MELPRGHLSRHPRGGAIAPSVDGTTEVLGDVVPSMTFRSGDVLLLRLLDAPRERQEAFAFHPCSRPAGTRIAVEESCLHISHIWNQTEDVPAVEEHPIGDEPALKHIRIWHALHVAELFEWCQVSYLHGDGGI